MIRPRYLKKGDTVGIVAPAGALFENEMAQAVEMIRSWGLEVVYGKYLFRRRHSFAGTDKQRAEDFQHMLDNSDIKTILCARGGYGAIRIISLLDFGMFQKNPKWIAGYSDITVLHGAVHNLGVETLHSVMPRTVPPKEPDLVSMESLRAMLFGETGEYKLDVHPMNRKGNASGILVGGNLSVLYGLAGTEYEPEMNGKVLFIEDLSEYLYHIDRMMMSLKIRGKLAGIKGLIVGDMLDMKSSSSGFKKPAYKIIEEAVKEYHYPVLFGFPAGHGDRNLALPLGREVEVRVGEKGSYVVFK